jgi:hypothetical protein
MGQTTAPCELWSRQPSRVGEPSFDDLGCAVVSRARANASSDYIDPSELQGLHHAVTRIKKQVNRSTWSQKRHHEAILLAAALRAAERATAQHQGRRVKIQQGLWSIQVQSPSGTIEAIRIQLPTRRHLDDFKKQIEVTVAQPALVNTCTLETWIRCQQMGLVRPRRRRRTAASNI